MVAVVAELTIQVSPARVVAVDYLLREEMVLETCQKAVVLVLTHLEEFRVAVEDLVVVVVHVVAVVAVAEATVVAVEEGRTE